jgi:hypothetical protein
MVILKNPSKESETDKGKDHEGGHVREQLKRQEGK